MTGRAAPSDLQLRENLNKRMFIPPGGRKSSLGGKREEKRFNRQGLTPVSQTKATGNSLAAADDEPSLKLSDIVDALSTLAGSGNQLKNKSESVIS